MTVTSHVRSIVDRRHGPGTPSASGRRPHSGPHRPSHRSHRLVAAATLTGGLCASAALATPAGASASVRPATSAPSYLQGHAYRHGAMPSLTYYRTHQAQFVHGNSTNDLNYGGGIAGVGVTTGPERIYLVFWGGQWGTQSTNGSGDAVFTGDPQSMAPDLQEFFKGLGNTGDSWSGVMTQYCQGISSGQQSCPANDIQQVAYPYGGALAGVWEDKTTLAPSAATAHQIALEASAAATQFGNTTQASNLDAQYVVVSPTGTDPDNYQLNGFCAWHDWTGDSTMDGGGAVSSPDGLLAFTNLPYLTDAGGGCGQNFVNGGSAGTLDGVTIVEGHEYAETVTDQFPAGGWTDSGGSETGDKCAWISSGQGASQNITLTTGTFAVQSTWANDFNGGVAGCEVSHAIVSDPEPTVTSVSPATGPTNGGTAITIRGVGFASPATVSVGQGSFGSGAIKATHVVVVSSTEITAVTGGGAKAGQWNV
ncbi:MAG TPA: IPT/TIG domain-containing protein, partial [Acidimicrobiales bacterium]|nr:IPT/TIG domain-containing protein [Acidimicrobiales bacterium]